MTPACTARWATDNVSHRAGDTCGQPAVEQIGDSDLCRHHFNRALNWFYQRKIGLPEKHQRDYEESLQRAAEKARIAAEARSIVYFLRRGDGMIKIGTTSRYAERLIKLQVEHGPLRLLLAYAGTRKQEREAHHRYYYARAEPRSEWFRPEPSLLRDILRMRGAVARLGRPTALPEQVPLTEIRALVKATRKQTA